MTGGAMKKETLKHKDPEAVLYAVLDNLDVKRVSDTDAAEYRSIFDNKVRLNRMITAGLSYSLFEHLRDKSPFSKDEWANFLDISIKTLDRYKQAGKTFKASQSEKIVGMIEVLERGKGVFGDMDIFKRWLYTHIPAMSNTRPIDLLSTSYGKDRVLDELTRIEHGIFA
jgi:putative toxin-antitoxin system antitoxin component (TIGR02293 family)